MRIRAERQDDRRAVDALIREVMGASEAQLVEQLHGQGDIAFAFIAEADDAIVGHILFSPMRARFRALGLAPLCVSSDRQRQGIGSALVGAGLAAAGDGWEAVFVVGDPAYYGRFGFSVEAAAGFDSPYAGPHLMVHDLGKPLPAITGRVGYAPAFASL